MPCGDGERAGRHGARALAVATEANLPGPKMMALYATGLADVLAGRTADGIEHLEAGLALSHRIGYATFRTEAHLGLALGHLARGDLEAASRAYSEGLERVAAGERKLAKMFERVKADLDRRSEDS
jgi:hypothetical protein